MVKFIFPKKYFVTLFSTYFLSNILDVSHTSNSPSKRRITDEKVCDIGCDDRNDSISDGRLPEQQARNHNRAYYNARNNGRNRAGNHRRNHAFGRPNCDHAHRRYGRYDPSHRWYPANRQTVISKVRLSPDFCTIKRSEIIA